MPLRRGALYDEYIREFISSHIIYSALAKTLSMVNIF